MSQPLDELVAELERAVRTAQIDEFVVVERAVERAELSTLGGAERLARHITEQVLEVLVLRDVRQGRGSVRLRLSGQQQPAALVARAAAEAAQAVGPAWSLPPAAAPARVEVADPDIAAVIAGASGPRGRQGAQAALGDVAQALVAELERLAGEAGPGGAPAGHVARHLAASVQHSRTRVRTSQGVAHEYPATWAEATAVLVPGQKSAAPGLFQRVELRGRRLPDLALAAELERAAGLLSVRTQAAVAPPAGSCDLVLTGSALVPGRVSCVGGPWRAEERATLARYGWLAPLAAQANGRLARLGLTRYRPGQPIAGSQADSAIRWGGSQRCGPSAATGASTAGAPDSLAGAGAGPATAGADRIDLASDGTVAFGLLSAPVGELGEPVRRFPLVRGGVAADLGLDLREAALRGILPNGGVRNLVLTAGSVAAAALREVRARPVLEAVSLAWLEIDVQRGTFNAAVELGYWRRNNQSGRSQPVTGAVVRGDLFALLDSIRLSADMVSWGWYVGPEAIRLSSVALA